MFIIVGAYIRINMIYLRSISGSARFAWYFFSNTVIPNEYLYDSPVEDVDIGYIEGGSFVVNQELGFIENSECCDSSMELLIEKGYCCSITE